MTKITSTIEQTRVSSTITQTPKYYIEVMELSTPADGIARVLCQQDSWKLAVGVTGGTLYLSDDCGASWAYSIAFANTTKIRMAYVFKNGNVLISTKEDNKIYLSDDLLTSINEITVKDIQGNVIINGGFSTDSNWDKGAGWTITGGKAVATATTLNLVTSVYPLVLGETYRITYTVSDYSSGRVWVRCGSDTSGTIRMADGTYTEDLVCSGTTGLIFSTGVPTTLKIDNVQAKKLTGTTPDLVKHTPVNATYPGIYFGAIHPRSFMQDSTEILLWGTYWQSQDDAGAGAVPINLYYTADQGQTVKCCYHFGDNTQERDDGTAFSGASGGVVGDLTNSYICHHVHTTSYDGNYWYIETGDGYTNNEICNLKGTYDIGTDTWTFIHYALNSSAGVFKMAGKAFDGDGSVFWASDDATQGGAYKCLVSDLLSNDINDHSQVYASPSNPRSDCISISDFAKYMILCRYNSLPAIVLSNNYGELGSWRTIPDEFILPQIESTSFKSVRKVWNKDDNDYFLIVHNSLASQCVANSFFIKIIETT